MSAKKRTSLDSVFGVQELPKSVPQKTRAEKAKPETLTPSGSDTPGNKRGEDSKRPAVKQHTAYLPHPVHEQLRKLALEENRKMHDYIIEGLDRVFANRGLPAVKDIS
jgi:hypothetical protein